MEGGRNNYEVQSKRTHPNVSRMAGKEKQDEEKTKMGEGASTVRPRGLKHISGRGGRGKKGQKIEDGHTSM